MPEEKILNTEDALERLSGDKELLFEISEIFLDDLKNHWSRIEKRDQMDRKDLAREFHSICGSSANVGADRLSYVSRQMEALVKKGGDFEKEMAGYETLLQNTGKQIREAISNG